MKSFTEIAAVIGGFALFRHKNDHRGRYLYYLDEDLVPRLSPWSSVPSEAEVCEFLGIPPWDDIPLPILSYIEENG